LCGFRWETKRRSCTNRRRPIDCLERRVGVDIQKRRELARARISDAAKSVSAAVLRWARKWARTNRRRADDKLPCPRPESMAATNSDNVRPRPIAISLSPLQNASSRLTLVLWPATTIERLATGDFITSSELSVNSDSGDGPDRMASMLRARCATSATVAG
jgi:hypothetical protein